MTYDVTQVPGGAEDRDQWKVTDIIFTPGLEFPSYVKPSVVSNPLDLPLAVLKTFFRCGSTLHPKEGTNVMGLCQAASTWMTVSRVSQQTIALKGESQFYLLLTVMGPWCCVFISVIKVHITSLGKMSKLTLIEFSCHLWPLSLTPAFSIFEIAK